jgi:transcription-repair coupling factor (superfamily II helicase)
MLLLLLLGLRDFSQMTTPPIGRKEVIVFEGVENGSLLKNGL